MTFKLIGPKHFIVESQLNDTFQHTILFVRKIMNKPELNAKNIAASKSYIKDGITMKRVVYEIVSE